MTIQHRYVRVRLPILVQVGISFNVTFVCVCVCEQEVCHENFGPLKILVRGLENRPGPKFSKNCRNFRSVRGKVVHPLRVQRSIYSTAINHARAHDPVADLEIRGGGSSARVSRAKNLSHTHNSPGHAHLSVAARRFCVSTEVRRRFSIINRFKGKLIAASRGLTTK